MKKIALLILPLFFALYSQDVTAQVQLNENAKVSLLTASRWHGAVYALFGHTAIRVQDDSTGVDAVFNYGYFDPTQPNFTYNFIRGKTDYVLGVNTFNEFIYEYEYKGQEVIEQELNLSISEKQQLYNALFINALPENRRYRYNFLFDNCATRPRDMVEMIIQKPVQYPSTRSNQTFRDLIHECVNEFAWMKFGIDLVIGSDADKFITDREKMFLPLYLMEAFRDAKVLNNDTINTPLVKSTNIILESDSEEVNNSEQFIIKPVAVAFALLLFTLIISFLQARYNYHKTERIYDSILFSVAGVAGLVVTFLVFFSEHPAVSPNWNLSWLHFMHLIIAVLFWVKSMEKVVYYYHFINFAVLSLFLISWCFLPQQLPLATIPFAMSLWLRSGTNYLIGRKDNLKNKQFKSAKYMQAGWKR